MLRSPTTLFIGDCHFDDKNIMTHREWGNKTSAEHDEAMMENIRSAVNKRDTLVMVGDIANSVPGLEMVKSIVCGKKTLILGNHDTDKRMNLAVLAHYYQSIYSTITFKGEFVLSHVPINKQCFRNASVNVHAHQHNVSMNDPDYFSVSADMIDFKPITENELLERVRANTQVPEVVKLMPMHYHYVERKRMVDELTRDVCKMGATKEEVTAMLTKYGWCE